MASPRRSTKTSDDPLAAAFVARRLQLGLTQSDLALLAGVGRSTIQSIESGKSTVQLDGSRAVADALGCDLRLVTRSGTTVQARP
ncbi:helix-turn-helix transcriptional regulator [Rhodococcus sp. BP-252]|uniref:helix-turn-helix domain-containing protein n=1 Tax=unclassified Rhodococcus (in: high G+C Gram-positive bacteria) TaxID=192944 RepID=UPI000DF11A63|nr:MULTISPECIES: helix-turn-helix domain-containing protein [unclassified Rhodococcus (in: high G+C Gram-positive bacteria)]MBY6414093.1 helix-turn-helix transcriptional regulator [Rhodococcus sp. BP-320]MBY6418864.1 helix-turn-helix transcriptional regulator [Rhodococcus sp. BP-321]MBY6423391.1 helix-turn-helix transcriptional regulator [Rhodococcus sp. BP-324]MBY6428845.1 helix-turn-helix transcriptional regulator [Rhodococcus sp. BP-323]MBY6433851.1 helix-turn-helix transcriptional regulato